MQNKEVLFFALADGSWKGARASRRKLHAMQEHSRFFGVCSTFLPGYGHGAKMGLDESSIPVEDIKECDSSPDGEHEFDSDCEECNIFTCNYCGIPEEEP